MLTPADTLDTVPDLGGALTQWHIHDNLCFTNEPGDYKVAGTHERRRRRARLPWSSRCRRR